MSSFYDNNVTDVGRLLLGDIQMGASFVPTKIVIGKGYMPAGKTTRTMTDVAEVVKELQLNKAMKNPNGDAIFGAIFTNEDITEAFYYRELAMYAKGVYFNEEGGVDHETEEVLYSYGNAGDNAELIPAYGTGTVVERQLDLLVYIGNDTQVSLTVETGLYVTIPVFNDTVAELRQEIEEVRYIVDSGDLKKYQWKMTNGTLSLDAVDGSGKVNIAEKETLDATKVVVDTINTNTSGLSTKIGETADTGGSSTAGSEFAKLNKIISDIAAHVAQWTAARAAKIDSIDTNAATASTKATEAANYGNEIKTQVAVNNTPSKTGTLSQKATQIIKDVEELNTGMGDVNVKLQDVAQQTTVNEIKNKIGTESDADTQPTLFGRLAQLKNVLLEKLAEVLTKVTGIDGKIGTSGDTAGSVTLFGQIKTIVDTLAGKKYRYSDTVQHTESATYSTTEADYWGKAIVLYNFEAEYDGVIHVSAQFNIPGGNSGSFGALHCLCESSWQPRSAATERMKDIEKCLNSPTGTTFSGYFSGIFTGNGEARVMYGGNFSKYASYGTNAEVHSLVKCKKGDKVSIVADIKTYNEVSSTVSNLKIMYDIK